MASKFSGTIPTNTVESDFGLLQLLDGVLEVGCADVVVGADEVSAEVLEIVDDVFGLRALAHNVDGVNSVCC